MTIVDELALKKPDLYETRKIQLTSPILHIGSSVSRLNPFEYVQTAKKVYLPNQEALAKGLLKKGGSFLNDYIQAIENREDITNLLKNAFGNEWWNTKDTNQNLIFPKNAISQNWTQEKISDLRPMIRNGMGYLFIPGSSIKGAMKTAILYHLLKHPDKYKVPQTTRVSEIEKQLKARLGELRNRRNQSSADDELMNSLFSGFSLIYQGKTFSGKSQNTDILRCLKVSDSESLIEKRFTSNTGQPIAINLPVVTKVIVSSRFADYRAKHKAPLYVEMVRNVKTQFTITIDKQMLALFQHNQGMKLPFNNIDELLEICQEFAQEQWDCEYNYWNDIKDNSRENMDFALIRDTYEPEKCPYGMRLGWGSGMTGTTIGLCFDDELRAELRDICGSQAPGFEAPKSRRTIMSPNGEIKFVPGWVKFKNLS
jgi:CRISPR-associated protein Csm5